MFNTPEPNFRSSDASSLPNLQVVKSDTIIPSSSKLAHARPELPPEGKQQAYFAFGDGAVSISEENKRSDESLNKWAFAFVAVSVVCVATLGFVLWQLSAGA